MQDQTSRTIILFYWFSFWFVWLLGQANYIHSLASATSSKYMRAGGNLIKLVVVHVIEPRP